ncbi:transmembrane protease serine 11C-like isoform X3 [Hypanus sabinus]|uniref:transmembrane protease serine 11C-like isoform X3 n=1 Tax=Hypanus sabinus TaxID=79690 RepID=UPI0028C3B420|nr:transmembrane protease serine 11C-like isoform X3 [Hypanus sabinus]
MCCLLCVTPWLRFLLICCRYFILAVLLSDCQAASITRSAVDVSGRDPLSGPIERRDKQFDLLTMKTTRCIVTTILIICGLAAIIAVVVAILAIFLTKAANSSPWKVYYKGNFRILNVPYNDNLATSSSMEFFVLANKTHAQLRSVYSKSRLSNQFGLAQVIEFSSGSVKVVFVLQFQGNGSTPTVVGAIKETFQQSLTQLNTFDQSGYLDDFIIDLTSIQFTEISKAEADALFIKAMQNLNATITTEIPTTFTSKEESPTIQNSDATTTMEISNMLTSKEESQTCGSQFGATSKIVGGTNSEDGEWPWQVSLQVGYHVCGASIISDSWLISAAHCFQMQRSNPSEWQAYMGSVELRQGTRRDIKRIIIHPSYRTINDHNYDIAVLELLNPLNFSKFIQPICLPSSSKIFPDGQHCTVTGWGTLAFEGQLPDILQKGNVVIISEQTCKHAYEKLITPIMLCAGILTGEVDSCQGDSGGPLACKQSDGFWFLTGIVSFGKGCANPGFPGVYTRVTAIREWVQEQTGV